MNREEYDRIHQAFVQVCEIEPSDREEALDRVCGGDSELRRRVEALLAVDADSRQFLSEPALPGGRDLEAMVDGGLGPSLLGRRIGGFAVERVIASGGMGTVYQATQEKPRRTVALKVMGRGIASRSAARRFEYESQVLARLQHPGIAQVHEVGTYSGGPEGAERPFFAMEYVPDARTLTAYAEETGLALRQKLELFAGVCDAVEHGHRNGVIHRDLKPANILVDPGGHPKVIDFGIAKATDSDLARSTAQTDVGQLIGTLQYMSPEQCRADPGELDTRSDVYSLGLVLYELLCGELPYDVTRARVHEAVRIVCDEAPRRPSTVRRVIRGDLETIVLKALEKDRERRYSSAAELASDIRRFLGDEPITARPPSALYQIQKFAKRNRALSAAAAASLLVLAAGVITTSAQAARASTAEQSALALARTEGELRRAAETARVRAEAGEAEARRQATIASEISAFLQDDLLGAVDPALARGREITVREVFDTASRGVEGRFQDEPLIEASIRTTLGRMYLTLSASEAALPQFERAHELRVDALGEGAALTVASLNDLGSALRGVARYEEAEDALRAALDRRRELLGEEHEDTRVSMLELADVYVCQAQYDGALALLSAVDALNVSHPPEDERIALKAKSTIALIYWETGHLEQAAELQQEVYDRHVELYGEDHPDTLSALSSLGASHMMMQHFELAEELLVRATELAPAILGEDHEETLIARNNLLWTRLEQRKFEQVVGPYEDVVARMAAEHGDDDPDTVIVRSNYSAALAGVGRFDEALEQIELALESARRVLPGHWGEAGHLERLGQALNGLGRSEEARDAFYLARDTALERLGPEDGRTFRTRTALVDFLVAEGLDEEAVDELGELLPLMLEVYGEGFIRTSVSMDQYGMLLWKLGRYDEALEAHERAHELRVANFGEEDQRSRESLYNVAVQLFELGELDPAIDVLEELHDLNVQLGADMDGFGVYVRATLAKLYNRAQRHEHALELIAVALPIAARHPNGAPMHGGLLVQQGLAFTGLGRFAEAEQVLLEAETLLRGEYGAGHEPTQLAVQALIDLYVERGDEEEARQWRARLGRGFGGSGR